MEEGSLRFADPEGLSHELVVDTTGDEPLIADHPEVPPEHALRGFHGARAYSADPDRSNQTGSVRRSRCRRLWSPSVSGSSGD